MDHLAAAAEQAGSGQNHRRDGIEDELTTIDVAGHAAEIGGIQQEPDARGEGADDETQGSDGGKIDAGPARCFGISPDSVDVTPKPRSLKNCHPDGEYGKHDWNDPWHALLRAEGGPVDIADRHHRGRHDRDQYDLEKGQADRGRDQAAAAPPTVAKPE